MELAPNLSPSCSKNGQRPDVVNFWATQHKFRCKHQTCPQVAQKRTTSGCCPWQNLRGTCMELTRNLHQNLSRSVPGYILRKIPPIDKKIHSRQNPPRHHVNSQQLTLFPGRKNSLRLWLQHLMEKCASRKTKGQGRNACLQATHVTVIQKR
jgi:hypothetical protein